MYRTVYILKKKQNTHFFSSPPGMCSRIDHILGHKTSLNEFKRLEIIQSIFFNHNSMKLEVNHNKKNGNRTNTRRRNNINNTLLKPNESVMIPKGKSENTFREIKMKIQLSKIYEIQQKQL